MNDTASPRDPGRDAEPRHDGEDAVARDTDLDDVAAVRDDEPRTEAGRDFLLEQPGEPSGSGDRGGPEQQPHHMPSAWVFVGAGAVLLALLGWGAYGHWTKHEAAKTTLQQTTDRKVKVRTVEAKLEDGPVAVTLPGETQAFDVANIYARATGYVSERRVDIGSRVKQGDLLLHIAAPDLDQQLAQARAQFGQVQAALTQAQAQVAQAEANLNLAKVNLGRADALVGKGFETLQNRDQLQANQISQQATLESSKAGVKVAEANVKAQQATIDRLEALTAFEDVRAPFDGVITVRNTDIGALINADTSSGSPLFTIARDDVLRVMVQIPQERAVGIKDGLEAKVRIPQFPKDVFEGKVTRSSNVLVTSARTLTTEVDIPNQSGRLRSGLFAYVSIDVPRAHPTVTVPAEALIFNQEGMQVAVVDGDGKIALHQANIYRDHGTSVELRDGLDGGEKVVVSPPSTLEAGTPVEIDDGDKQGGKPEEVSQK